MASGVEDDRAIVSHQALTAPDRLLVKRGCGEIPEDSRRVLDPVLFEAVRGTKLYHSVPSPEADDRRFPTRVPDIAGHPFLHSIFCPVGLVRLGRSLLD